MLFLDEAETAMERFRIARETPERKRLVEVAGNAYARHQLPITRFIVPQQPENYWPVEVAPRDQLDHIGEVSICKVVDDFGRPINCLRIKYKDDEFLAGEDRAYYELDQPPSEPPPIS